MLISPLRVVLFVFVFVYVHTQGTSQLLTDASQSRNPADNNNRRRRQLLRSAHAAGHRRHLHAAPAAAPVAAAPAPAAKRPTGAPIPVIPKEEARVERVPPTVSPLMTLQEMLCNVKSYSPSGLKGMLLPDRKTNGTGQGRPIVCPPVPEPAIFRYKQLVFKPVKIPVVFHCECAGGIREVVSRVLLGVENRLREVCSCCLLMCLYSQITSLEICLTGAKLCPVSGHHAGVLKIPVYCDLTCDRIHIYHTLHLSISCACRPAFYDRECAAPAPVGC